MRLRAPHVLDRETDLGASFRLSLVRETSARGAMKRVV
jgi:hypothetical protein